MDLDSPDQLSQLRKSLNDPLESFARKRDFVARMSSVPDHGKFGADRGKRLERRWRIGEVAKMVGRTTQAIRDIQRRGGVVRPPTPRDYSLSDINEIRRVFGTLPWRMPEEEPVVVAFQNLMAGVGKSTLAVHFAQYLAIRGYRILLVDCDPKGCASILLDAHSCVPADHLVGATGDYSLQKYFSHFFDDFSRCLRPTYFAGLDIVPAGANLDLANHYLAAQLPSDPRVITRLRDGIHQVWQAYDVVVLDSPPGVDWLCVSVANAATALVTPIRPTFRDFSSASYSLSFSHDLVSFLNKYDLWPCYHFNLVVVNKLNERKKRHLEISREIRETFSMEDMVSVMMRDSAEIQDAAEEMWTVYDLNAPMTTHDAYRQCITDLDCLNHELEFRVRRAWPSHANSLSREGRI